MWKRPRIWFRFIIGAFIINLFVAIVTVERHISSSVTTIKASSLEMDHPRISPLSTESKSHSGQQQGTISTESRIWHRILLQKERTNQNSSCNNQQAENQTMVAELYDGVAKLSPFGFAKSVQAYVREHENRSSTSNDGVSMSSTYCLAPPSEPSCQSTQYTVVIYSSGRVKNADSTDTDTKQNDY